MKLEIDESTGVARVSDGSESRVVSLGSPEWFSIVSKLWLRAGWDTKYVYSFTWMGRPIIQLPEDMFRLQEVIYRVKPDVIVETGVAHGGSLVFYASLFQAMGNPGGRVIGVDIEIRPHNRAAIESHELAGFITLIEGGSTDAGTFSRVVDAVGVGQKVLVVLDSNHSKAHVLRELELYSSLVPVGSYVVATDGIMKDLVGAPRSNPDWGWNNPSDAAREFVSSRADFRIEEPTWEFNEGALAERVTYWPNAYVRRVA